MTNDTKQSLHDENGRFAKGNPSPAGFRQNPEKPLSHFSAIIDATNDLNRRTEQKLAEIFDKSFLANHSIDNTQKGKK